MNDEPLTAGERDRLHRARIDVAPPRALEERTVALLRERGLIRPRRSWVAAGVLAAAAAVLLAATLWLVPPRSPASSSAGPRYMLLLYAGDAASSGSADTRRSEYSQWARDVASRGVAITGEELSDEAREVGGTSPAVLLPRGFFIVDVPDLASAERIASSCPHLRHGGRIVIKPIV